MIPKPPHKPEDGVDNWLMSYADMITLLLAFFIIFVSTSEPKQERLLAATRGMQERFGSFNLDSPYDEIFREVQGIVASENGERFIAVEKTQDGVQMELSSGYFFIGGTADIPTESMPLLQKIVEKLKGEKLGNYAVIVEGHVNDEQVKQPFASAWELSAARAGAIARVMDGEGIDPVRIRAVAFGRTRPLVPNADAEGKPIPENRARNDRTVIRVEKKQGEPAMSDLSPLFVDDIVHGNDPSTAALIYADWQEERDNTDHAEFLRLQAALGRGIADRGDRFHAEERSNALLARHRQQWDADFLTATGITLPPYAKLGARYEYGVPAEVILDFSHESLNGVAPAVWQAELNRLQDRLGAHDVAFRNMNMGNGQIVDVVEWLEKRPEITGVDLAKAQLGSDGVWTLSQSAILNARLERLNLSENDIDGTGMQRLLLRQDIKSEEPSWPRLKELSLAGNPLAHEWSAFALLMSAESAPRLECLDVSDIPLRANTLSYVTRTDKSAQLYELALRKCELDYGLHFSVAIGTMPGLARLDMRGNPDDEYLCIAESTELKGLREFLPSGENRESAYLDVWQAHPRSLPALACVGAVQVDAGRQEAKCVAGRQATPLVQLQDKVHIAGLLGNDNGIV